MTKPENRPPTSLADVAAEPAEQSVAQERELVGGDEDAGDRVPEDGAQ